MNNIYFAAIDIGSNAVRLAVKSIGKDAANHTENLERELLIRFPLRLGKEVFIQGKISAKKAKQLQRLMKSFHQMLKIFSVTGLRACATSAMRDAVNGREIADSIRETTGIPVEIIGGEEEARIIYETHIERELGQENDYMYMDVGGGSTQISLIHSGKPAYSRSFNIGTVRMMSGKVGEKDMAAFLSELKNLRVQYPDFKLVGSGGNANKLYKLLRGEGSNYVLNVEKLRQLSLELTSLTVEKRMKQYKIKRDRAEVIGYAAGIFIRAADAMQIGEIVVPSISISDGIINNMLIEYMKAEIP